MNRPLIALLVLASAAASAAPAKPGPGRQSQPDLKVPALPKDWPAGLPIPALPRPPFTPQDVDAVARCLEKLGSPNAKDGNQYTSLLINDTAAFLKASTIEVMAALKKDVAAMIADVGKSDPSDIAPLVASAMKRLESQYNRVPPVKCLMPVLVPILQASTPMLIQLSQMAQAKLKEAWATNVEPKMSELIAKAIEQLIATAVGGEDAKVVLLQAVTAHMLDLPKVERTAAKVAAFSSAVQSKSGVQGAYDAVVPLVQPAKLDRARLAFQVVVEVAQVKGERFINRGCPSGAGAASSSEFLSTPGSWLNEHTFGKLEEKTPGLTCLIDTALKQVEHLIDTVHTAADGSCAVVPYGGAPVCTSIMWVMQFTAKYAALVVTKALALQFAQTLREAIIYLAAEEARRQLEARGAFDRVNRLIEKPPEFNTGNPNVDKALRLARPLAKRIAPAIDKTMRKYMDGEAKQYFDIIEAYNKGVADLVDATARKAGATTARR